MDLAGCPVGHPERAVGSLGRLWRTFGRDIAVRSAPDAMTLGPDGALWYVSGNEGKVGRVDVRRPR